MVKVTGSQDCGNSPKNQFSQEVAVALETGRIPSGMLSESIVWTHSASEVFEGRDAVEGILLERPKAVSVRVVHAISHGRVGMANGDVTLADGRSRRFSHVFDFTNTKGNCVSAISSYD